MGLATRYQDAGSEAVYEDAYLRVDPRTISLNFTEHVGLFEARVYISQAAADRGKSNVARRLFRVEGAEFDRVFGDVVTAAAYGVMKSQDDFKSARDVIETAPKAGPRGGSSSSDAVIIPL